VKATVRLTLTHNPWGEAYWASGLRENLTSRSYGEGLETGRRLLQVPRQSFTRQLYIKELKSVVGLGQSQVTKDAARVERSVAVALMAYLLLLRLRAKQIQPGSSWSAFTLKQGLAWDWGIRQVKRAVRQEARREVRLRPPVQEAQLRLAA
jgi:hypothetical protein